MQEDGVEHEGHGDGAPVHMAVIKVAQTRVEVGEDVRSGEDGVEDDEQKDFEHPEKYDAPSRETGGFVRFQRKSIRINLNIS